MADDFGSNVPLAPTRLIVLAMIAGIVIFAGVSLVLAPLIPNPGSMEKMLLVALGAVGLAQISGYFALRTVTLSRVRQQFADNPSAQPAEAFPAYHTLTLIRSAMSESFGLFGVVIFLLTGNYMSLAAGAVSVILLVAGMPTLDGFHRFHENATGANPFTS